MSYPQQWTATNMVPQAVNMVSQGGEMLPNPALFSPYNQNIRHSIPLNQANAPNQGAGPPVYCPNPSGGYSLVYPALMAAIAANSGAPQPREVPAYCFPQGFPQNTVAAAAAVLRGSALLPSPPAYRPQSNMPAQQVIGGVPYYQVPNGLPIAAFPGAAAAQFQQPNPPVSQQLPPPSHNSAMRGPPQFRSYDSLKHFGALPQQQQQHIHKRNKSMTTSKTNLYICGLSESDTDETVRALVEDVVRPKSCKAMLLNGKCKGSGFIDCATEDDALKALTHLNEVAKTTGRNLNVKYALENEKDLLNVYVRNLPKSGFTKETLEALFLPYGQVTSVKLLETDGLYTGIGFVRFATAEQAQLAVDTMNERRYVISSGDNDSPGEARPICCKLADKADPKRRPTMMPGGGTVSPVSGPLPRPSKPHHHPNHHNSQAHHPQHQHPINHHAGNQQYFQPEFRHTAVVPPPNHPLQQLIYPTHDLMAAAALCSPPLAGSYAVPPTLNHAHQSSGPLQTSNNGSGNTLNMTNTAASLNQIPPSVTAASRQYPAPPPEMQSSSASTVATQAAPPFPVADTTTNQQQNNNHHQFFSATNGLSGDPSRYGVAAQLAAAALSQNGAANSMYSPMAVAAAAAAVAAGQFNRMTAPTTTMANCIGGGGVGQFRDAAAAAAAFCSPQTMDLVADQLHSLSLRTQAVPQAPPSTAFYPEWQCGVAIPTPTLVTQTNLINAAATSTATSDLGVIVDQDQRQQLQEAQNSTESQTQSVGMNDGSTS